MWLDPELSQTILQKVLNAKHILLHFHPNPDGDSVGSTLGFAHALRAHGKEVTVIGGDSSLPKYLRHIPGIDNVDGHPYPLMPLENIDLFLILDSASTTQISRQSEVVFPEHLNTVVIDHHGTNPGFGQVNWVDPRYPATCQMVFDLLKSWEWEISRETAQCLFLGMYTDTGGFQYPPVSSATLRAAAELADIAPDFPQLLFPIDNTFEAGHIRYRARALSNAKVLGDGVLVWSCLSAREMEQLELKPEHADKSTIANELKSVVGWQVSVAAVEIEPGTITMSFRTRDPEKYHVGKIAAALGGGGHPAAAGLTLKMSIEEAEYAVLQAVQAYGQQSQ